MSSLIGALIWGSKKITQKTLGLSDDQVIHPKVASNGIYDKWHKYKKVASFYDKYNLLYIGLVLVISGPVIEIILWLES